jgi:hypothetical protein
MSELHGGTGAGRGSQDDDSLGGQGRIGPGRLGRSVLEVWIMIQITPQMRIWLAVEPVDFRNHSERVIIPSASQRPMKIMADVAGFVLCDSE